jgi:hypothetical protein
MEICEDTTNPVILVDSLSRTRRMTLPYRALPAFLAGDFVISPSGVEGYIAGRSLETPGAWMFVIKNGPGRWDQTMVEMMPRHFLGFRLKERKK